jgi:hypothetical protein
MHASCVRTTSVTLLVTAHFELLVGAPIKTFVGVYKVLQPIFRANESLELWSCVSEELPLFEVEVPLAVPHQV